MWLFLFDYLFLLFFIALTPKYLLPIALKGLTIPGPLFAALTHPASLVL
jgi:hypothetical protein